MTSRQYRFKVLACTIMLGGLVSVSTDQWSGCILRESAMPDFQPPYRIALQGSKVLPCHSTRINFLCRLGQ